MRKPYSFDIFDTLIARRCIEPKNVFHEVEKAVNLAGFANLRVQAEASVAAGPYTLDDIYRVFVEKFGFNTERSEYLKAKEIELEVHNAIAIKENLEAVDNGDILVTDMYLPRSAILSILDKVGLRKQVGLVISSSGKHSGHVWPKLKFATSFEQHCGDNPHSDVHSPLSSGIYAEHLANSALTVHESFFRINGFELLARAMREARLTCLSAQYGNEANLQALAQINNNIPILLLTSVYLKLLSTKIGASNILFSSRDCYYLSRLFNLLREQARWNIASEYFYTSRICRTSPSDSYLKYFQSRASPNTLVVDLAGTGWSLEQLYEKAGVTPHTFLLHHLSNSPLKERYQQIQKSEKSIIPFSMLDGLPLDNSQLETVNYVDSGMVLDVLVVDGYDSAIPVLEYPNYPKSTVNVIRNIESTHELFANVLAHFDLPALVHEIEASADKIAGVVAELYKHLCDTNSSMRDLALYHARQDRRTMWKLKK